MMSLLGVKTCEVFLCFVAIVRVKSDIHVDFFVFFVLRYRWVLQGFCPGVRVHKGITVVLSLFRSHWLAVVYCLVLCSGSCEPVHENRTITGSVTPRMSQNDAHFVAIRMGNTVAQRLAELWCSEFTEDVKGLTQKMSNSVSNLVFDLTVSFWTEQRNRPFYSCLLSDLAFEWQRGWRWPCFDTDLSAFVV